jgi:hypothetical protein
MKNSDFKAKSLIKRKLFIWLAIKTSSFEEYSFAYLILI